MKVSVKQSNDYNDDDDPNNNNNNNNDNNNSNNNNIYTDISDISVKELQTALKKVP